MASGITSVTAGVVTGDQDIADQALIGDQQAKSFSEDHPVRVKRTLGTNDLLPLSRQNGVGNGPSVGTDGSPEEPGDISLELNVTAVWGTSPVLVCYVQTQDPKTNQWETIGSFSKKTDTGKQKKTFSGAQGDVRAFWEVTGVGVTFEFAVTNAEADAQS